LENIWKGYMDSPATGLHLTKELGGRTIETVVYQQNKAEIKSYCNLECWEVHINLDTFILVIKYQWE